MGIVILKPITEENQAACLELSVHEDQKRFVASNSDSLKKAMEEPSSNPQGIYAGDVMVGFTLFDWCFLVLHCLAFGSLGLLLTRLALFYGRRLLLALRCLFFLFFVILVFFIGGESAMIGRIELNRQVRGQAAVQQHQALLGIVTVQP